MQKRLATALFGALLVLFFSGCDSFLSGLGECNCDGGEPPVKEEPFLKLLEGEESPPNPVIPATDGSEHLYRLPSAGFRARGDLYGKSRSARDTSVARPEVEVVVYEIAREKTSYAEFVKEVEDLTSKPVDSLTFSEHQLIEFAVQNEFWITHANYNNFVFLEIENEVLLVQVSTYEVVLKDMSDTDQRYFRPFEVHGGEDGPGVRMAGNYTRVILPKFEDEE